MNQLRTVDFQSIDWERRGMLDFDYNNKNKVS